MNTHLPSPIARITEFIECLVQKQLPWTKTSPGILLLHKLFVALTKTSPKIFLHDWKKNGDLLPSDPALLWTAAINVLGCSFALVVPIKTTAKGILKKEMNSLKLNRKKLMFDPVCVSTSTKVGRFLTDKVPRQLFTKKLRVTKQFTRKQQLYIKLTICGNMYGVQKYEYFVPELHKMIEISMELAPCLVVILFPSCHTSKTASPFTKNASMLTNSTRCRIS